MERLHTPGTEGITVRCDDYLNVPCDINLDVNWTCDLGSLIDGDVVDHPFRV